MFTRIMIAWFWNNNTSALLFCTQLCVYFIKYTAKVVGRDSSVGIASCYGLDGPGIESRWRTRFYARVQTGPGAHPASSTMDTGFLSRG
jgi:hypothetical protein